MHPNHRLATGAHNGEERLHTMDAVPEQVVVCGLNGGRTVDIYPDDFTHLAVADGLGAGHKAQGRGGKYRYLVALGRDRLSC